MDKIYLRAYLKWLRQNVRQFYVLLVVLALTGCAMVAATVVWPGNWLLAFLGVSAVAYSSHGMGYIDGRINSVRALLGEDLTK